MSAKTMNLTLYVWRQKNASDKGQLVKYEANGVSPDMSFLEMLDVVNEGLIAKGEEPIAFDHDCREGICGTCGMVINGIAHGPRAATTTCQLHMRTFNDGDSIYIEPWRAKAFPVIKDLVVDRAAFDRIIAAGGFVSASTGSAPDGNAIPVPKPPPASAAAPAWPHAPTARQCCLHRPKFHTSATCHKDSRNATGALSAWWTRWTPKASEIVPTTANAKPYARKKSGSSSSRA
jgi:hypothetical protein